MTIAVSGKPGLGTTPVVGVSLLSLADALFEACGMAGWQAPMPSSGNAVPGHNPGDQLIACDLRN